jgi:hypothetical protein
MVRLVILSTFPWQQYGNKDLVPSGSHAKNAEKYGKISSVWFRDCCFGSLIHGSNPCGVTFLLTMVYDVAHLVK